jgi:hypothetical protein
MGNTCCLRQIRVLHRPAIMHMYPGWCHFAMGVPRRAEGGLCSAVAWLFFDGSADPPEVLAECVGRFGFPPC